MLTTHRHPALLAVAVTVASLLAACGGARSRYESHMQRGQAYYDKGDFAKAGVEFRNAMQILPKDAAARVKAGQSAEKLGRLRDALSLYQAVVDSQPDELPAHQNLARVLDFVGQPDAALKVIEPALVKHPDEASLLTLRALARMQRKDMVGAIADADLALQVAPANEEAIALRAGLYRQSGDLETAYKLVGEGVQRLPGSGSLRLVYADLAMALKQPGEAEIQLLALVKQFPKDLQYRSELALFYSRIHRVDDAQKALEGAVDAAPDSEQAKLNLATFVATQRSRAQAEEILRKYIAQSPDNDDLRLALGSLLEHFDATQDAVKVYAEVTKRDPKGPSGVIARDRMAAIESARGNYDQANRLIAEVLQLSARDRDALTLRAQISLRNQEPAAAIGDLRSVLRDQPNAWGILRLLGEAYVANGQPALAEQALRDALTIQPAETSLQIELAQLLEKTNHTDQAVTLLEGAARSAPTEATIREALVGAYLAKGDFVSAHTAAQDLQILQPKSAAGFYLAGLASQGQGQLDDAQQSFEHALQMQPDALDSLDALAKLKLRRGQPDQAIALVQSTLTASTPAPAPGEAANRGVANQGNAASPGIAAKDGGRAFRLNLLGELYLAEKNPALAKDTLIRATTAAPGWSVPYRNLGIACYAAKDVPGAIAAYQSAIRLAPSDARPASELAEIYKRQGRTDDAIASYDALYRRNPEQEAVANNLALLLVTYKTDRASLDRALDLTQKFASSSNGILLDTGGWVHFKRAEYTEALPMLERASERAPDSKEIRYHLGMAELRSGQKDRARQDLQTALSGSANFAGADEARTALAALQPASAGL